MKKSNPILIVGTGAMALEYTKVLKDLNVGIIAIGKDKNSIKEYEEKTKINVVSDDLDKFLKTTKHLPGKAIIVVPENMLGRVAIKLIKSGIKSILVEKPGGANIVEIKKVATTAKKYKTEVFVGYNRRQYASVEKAKEIIKKDGGVTSFNFEFTEWSHVIAPLKKAPGVKEDWFLHNSTHVIDMAFYLGGKPKKICSYTAGKLTWHPKASAFAGAGIADNGVLFSYQANWSAPGRWSVEILTKKHRLIFRPLEKLQIQDIGSVAISEVKIDDKLDLKYKAGLYKQVDYFITEKKERLCDISEQAGKLKTYQLILK